MSTKARLDGVFVSQLSLLEDSFDYEIKRQRRKTVALHVLDDGRVEVRAPTWLSRREIITFVENRIDWVVAQRRERLRALERQPNYRDGQYHRYLGQSFPLHIQRASRRSVNLTDGVFIVAVREPSNQKAVADAMQGWYRERAGDYYEERLFACFESFPDWFQDKYTMPTITVRKMRRRWGSCSRNGDITLNLSLVTMPIPCLDYVITHELCHLEVFHHGKPFYSLLQRVMPDWKQMEKSVEDNS